MLSLSGPLLQMELGTLVLLSLLMICSAFSLSEHLNENEVFEPELQSTSMPICNNKSNLSCPKSDFSRDNRIQFCGFSCPQGKEYRCKEDDDHGIIEFCAKSEICDKGQRNSVYFDEEHKSVVIKKAICPKGFFQPFKQDCYISCTQYHHINETDLLGYGVKVLYPGNATSAGIGYCDIDNDYVNGNSKMYINLTGFEVNVCEKKDVIKVECEAGQRLLPDSTCASKCEEGYVVDKENFFTCSIKSSNTSVIHKSSTKIPSITSSTKVPSNSGISPSKHITSDTTPSTTAQQNGAEVNIGLIIGCSVVGGIFVICLICLIVWFLRRRSKNKRKGERNSRNNHEGKSKTINGRKVYKRCDFSKISTTHGNINVTFGIGVAKDWVKQFFRETGIENKSDEESGGTNSMEPEYDAVRGQQMPGQDTQAMMELKSVFTDSRQTANSEETEVLKPWT